MSGRERTLITLYNSVNSTKFLQRSWEKDTTGRLSQDCELCAVTLAVNGLVGVIKVQHFDMGIIGYLLYPRMKGWDDTIEIDTIE
jgi:hypothetical protein